MGRDTIENRAIISNDKQFYFDSYQLKDLVYRMQIALKINAHNNYYSLSKFNYNYNKNNRSNPFGFDDIKGKNLKHKNLIQNNNCLLHKLLRIQNEFKFVKKNIEYYKQLTLREKEITQWLAKGYNNREIGKNLFISRCTVEQHRKHINQKLGITSLPHLLQYAYSFNLI